MVEINHQIHDIRNKLTLLSGSIFKLNLKYNDQEFQSMSLNIERINEILKNMYLLNNPNQKNRELGIQVQKLNQLTKILGLLLDEISLMYPIECEVIAPHHFAELSGEVYFDKNLFLQVLENAVQNSLNAKATKIKLCCNIDHENFYIDIVDNGESSSINSVKINQDPIPHGVGSKIILTNMRKLKGNAALHKNTSGIGHTLSLTLKRLID